jgi:hypothetical protein
MALDMVNKLCEQIPQNVHSVIAIDCFAFFALNAKKIDINKCKGIKIEIPEATFVEWLEDNIQTILEHEVVVINDINTIFHEISFYQSRGSSHKLWKMLMILSFLFRQNKHTCLCILHERHESSYKNLSRLCDFMVEY